jgi:lipopolysaccharide heptosyltransferase III
LNPVWRIVRNLREHKSLASLNREIAVQAKSTLEKLKSLKAQHRGRKLCGILLTEHLGDIVACEPVIPWLKDQHPDDFVVWLTRPAYAGLLKQHPLLDAVEEVGSISVCGAVVRSGVLDRVVDLHLNRKPCTVFGSNYMKSWGRPEIDTENYFHQGTLLEAMSFGAGLPRLNGQPRLTLPPEAGWKVDGLGLPSSFAVIHARSNEETRNWDSARWNQLAEKLVDHFGLTLVEIGLDPVTITNGKDVINLCGQLSLIETAEVVHRAAFYFGTDSGPAHFANAFQIPSVILLGRYRDFNRYMPYTGFLRNHADSMIIQWEGPASEITVAEVLRRFEAIRTTVPIVSL